MAVRVDLMVSLDGFATTTDQTTENPFGEDWPRPVAAYAATRTFRECALKDITGSRRLGFDDGDAKV
jgi:hypothetical protein